MESLFLLIPLSVMAVAVAIAIFFHMCRAGQFDDDQGPAWSILLDDDKSNSTERNKHTFIDLDQ